jgi:TMEM175 potassium channel family protein
MDDRLAEAREARNRYRGARHREDWGLEFSRIVAFSDSVFAIAITLIALTIEVPKDLPATQSVGDVAWDRRGDFIAYAVSFAVLGRLWLTHHRFFSSLERFDGTLMGLNIFYLAWVALVPVTSDVLGDFGEESTGVILYAGNLLGLTATFAISIYYSYRAKLFKPEVAEMERRFEGPTTTVIAAVFALSIPVAIVSPAAATVMWLSIFLIGWRAGDLFARLRYR